MDGATATAEPIWKRLWPSRGATAVLLVLLIVNLFWIPTASGTDRSVAAGLRDSFTGRGFVTFECPRPTYFVLVERASVRIFAPGTVDPGRPESMSVLNNPGTFSVARVQTRTRRGWWALVDERISDRLEFQPGQIPVTESTIAEARAKVVDDLVARGNVSVNPAAFRLHDVVEHHRIWAGVGQNALAFLTFLALLGSLGWVRVPRARR
jgi:hypothetical protein